MDNPTFRGMRWNLLNTFDKIYTIDLHGNAKKKEVAPDGGKDENVFDIMQGVSINILIKTGDKKQGELSEVFHFDLFGLREHKYEFLKNNSLLDIPFVQLINKAPNYFMVQKDYDSQDKYLEGISLNELFVIKGNGITTAHDDFVIKNNYEELLGFYLDFQSTDRNSELLHQKFNVNRKKGWDILEGYDNIKDEENLSKYIKKVTYRPFDTQFIFYEDKLVWRTVKKVMSHIVDKDNISILTTKAHRDSSFAHIFLTKNISEAIFLSSKTGSNAMNLPLYVYPHSDDSLDITSFINSKDQVSSFKEEQQKRIPNLKPEVVLSLSENLNLTFVNEGSDKVYNFSPIDIFDFIYAVLHNNTYRETYKEFLKTDFPRVPYPKDAEQFWQLVALGGQLRQIHLLESPKLAEKAKTLGISYPEGGNNEVTRKMTKSSIGFEPSEDDATTGKVWINDEQYFDNIPLVAWEFYIGGYQPAQKWLKDRNGRTLNMSDIKHYMNVIAALSLTDELMQKIDEIDIIN